MNACKLGFGMDVGACLKALALGWVPDWFWTYGPWVLWGTVALVALGILARVKAVAGWPGLAAVLTAGGYVVGYVRGKRGESFNPIEQVPEKSPDAAPSPPKPQPMKRPRPTLFKRK